MRKHKAGSNRNRKKEFNKSIISRNNIIVNKTVISVFNKTSHVNIKKKIVNKF